MSEVSIRKPKSNSIQTRWIAVYWDGNQWTARQWTLTNGKECRIRQATGTTPVSWWDWLNAHCNCGESWWITGWQIYEFMCWSGIYQQIETNNLLLSFPRGRAYDKPLEQDSKRLYGALICENPPTIIDCVLCNGSRLKILDLGNWGLARGMFLEPDECESIDSAVQAIQDYITMVKCLDMGQLKTTAASQGWYTYRRSHMEKEIIADSTPQAREIERAGYFAGRCEAFRLGQLPEHVWHFDISAMYNSIALEARFPTKLLSIDYSPDIKRLASTLRIFHYIADVELCTPEPAYPLKYNGRTIYPVGTFRTVLCDPELRYAYKSGHITKIHRMAEYTAERIFDRFAEWYFKSLKQLHVLGLAHLTPALKQLANSTYGKIGQRSKGWVDVPGASGPYNWFQWWQRHPQHKKPVQWRTIDGVVQYLDAGGESPTSVPSISATMCSYGRMAIWRAILVAGRENVYYVDTDGIMVNFKGMKLLIDDGLVYDGIPGKFRLREQGDNVHIYGIKHYQFGDRYCCAGVPEHGRVIDGEHLRFRQHLPFDYGIWHREAFAHRYSMATRRHTRKYYHGEVFPSGEVAPWIMRLQRGENDGRQHSSFRDATHEILGSKKICPRESIPNGDL